MSSFREKFENYRATKGTVAWACAGTALVVVVLGFSWGGWVTGGSAREMAEDAADDARSTVLATVCVERFMAQDDAGLRLGELKEIDSAWSRGEFVEEGGWASIGGDANDQAADLCAGRLMDLQVAAATGPAPSVE